jgi:hypothetical protein
MGGCPRFLDSGGTRDGARTAPQHRAAPHHVRDIAPKERACAVEGPISDRASMARDVGMVASADARALAGKVAVKLTAKTSNTPNRVDRRESKAATAAGSTR